MLLDHVPDSQAKGSWRAGSACVHGHGFWGQHPQPRGAWMSTRGLGRMSWVTAIAGNFMSFLPSILWEGGTASHQLHSSHRDFFFFIFIFLLYYLSRYSRVPTDIPLVHHFITEQLHQNAIARIPFFPLSYTWSSSFTHKEENYLPLLLEPVGELAFMATTKSLPWLLWAYNTSGASPFSAQQAPLRIMMYSVTIRGKINFMLSNMPG